MIVADLSEETFAEYAVVSNAAGGIFYGGFDCLHFYFEHHILTSTPLTGALTTMEIVVIYVIFSRQVP